MRWAIQPGLPTIPRPGDEHHRRQWKRHRAEYDAEGNAMAITDALDHATQFAYDDIGRMIGMTDAANGNFTLDYDPADRPTEVVDAAGGIRASPTTLSEIG